MKILIVEKRLNEKKLREIDRVVKRRIEAGLICKKNPIYIIDSNDMGKKYFIKYILCENAQSKAFKCFCVLDTKTNRKKYHSSNSYKISNSDLKYNLPNFVDENVMIYNCDNLHIIHKNFGWQQLCNIYKYRYFNIGYNVDNEVSTMCLNDEYDVLCKYLNAANHDFTLPMFAYMVFSKCKSLFNQYSYSSKSFKKNFALQIKGTGDSCKNINIKEYISYFNKNFFDSYILGLGNTFSTEVDKKFVLPYLKTPFNLGNH